MNDKKRPPEARIVSKGIRKEPPDVTAALSHIDGARAALVQLRPAVDPYSSPQAKQLIAVIESELQSARKALGP